MGEGKKRAFRLGFDSKLKLEFHGAKVTSDAGLLAYRELDDVFSLTDIAADHLIDSRFGKNKQHTIQALLRQSVLGRLAGYEDTNDADRLRFDPAMRHVVGERKTGGVHERDEPVRDGDSIPPGESGCADGYVGLVDRPGAGQPGHA